jgi:predicted DNA-binding transcriptional regulator YafY
MPITKNFSRRIEILDRILDGIRRYEIDDLLLCLNGSLENIGLKRIGKRTLYYDIQYLEYEKNAPIHKPEPGDARYYYTTPFSLRNLPLTEDEIDDLKQATEILKKAMPFMLGNEMSELIAKLEQQIVTNTDDRSGIIQFESHTESIGSHWIEKLFAAIRSKAALRISYKPFMQDQAEEKVFFPYLLKEYRSRWFVLGRIEGGEKVYNMALDRIMGIRNSAVPFVENDLLDPDAFFRHLIGVSIPYDAEVQDVIIKVSPSLAPYIRTKPVHRLQEIIKEYADGGLKIRIPLYLNYELKSALLGHGEGIEVLQPQSLRDALKKESKAMYKKYDD